MSLRIAPALILMSLLGALACDGEKKDDKAAGSPSASSSAQHRPGAGSGTASAKSSSSAEAPGEAPAITVVPMKFTFTDPRAHGLVVELAADGTVKKGADVVAKFEKNHFEDKDGKVIMSVEKDGTLAGKGITRKATFDANDDLLADEGKNKLSIADDGTITATEGGKTEKAPITIEGFKKEGKRAATLVIALTFLGDEKHEAADVDGPAIVIVPLKLVSTDPKAAGKSIDLSADGTIKAGPEVIGKIVKNHLEDKNGKILVSVDKDGNLVGKDVMRKAGFDAKDELVGDEGKGKLVVGDDGSVTMTDGGKTQKAPLKIEGLKKEARRAATLVVVLALKGQESHAAAPTLSSATPAVSAPPPKQH